MMQHQYWVTKKTVLKKLGTKEDDCIVSSDAELDAKLELFRSISDSCLQLQRILDQYQERLCVLAQEENSLGKFLKEAGKTSDPSGVHMVSAGKAISYSGQQRLSIRSPLLRLYHEVETFRARAVSDMRCTVSAMEKARTEYRAALSWMKSTSAQLDPDTGRGLDNFRKAQRQVRESKKAFDKLTLDVLQKIDLLAAARCNMFSHVLTNYTSSFLQFSSKVAQTLVSSAETMTVKPQYQFTMLAELSQKLGEGDEKKTEAVPADKDQMLFFQDEYKDDDAKSKDKTQEKKEESSENNETVPSTAEASSVNLIDTSEENAISSEGAVNADLAGLRMDAGDMASQMGSFMPSQMLQDLMSQNLPPSPMAPSTSGEQKKVPMKVAPKKEDKAAWFKLFAELDPLANPDSMPGANSDHSHAA
ncbi:islet cell autoantigen 1 [Plutella xylostella]|uniref:islet cell autoantigen 1 n=1 Tax=Plutella xylostella TaxID=51655 RepID=UPI002032C7CE|nr:islet cell autoantigen 1 [Plutella xylostella]